MPFSYPHTIEFPETGLPGQAFEVGVHRLPNLCQPGSAIAGNTKTELVFFLQDGKGGFRHQIFIDRSKRSTSLDPHVSPMQSVAQMRERCNLVKPPIRFSFFEDELFLGWPEMADRHAIRQKAPALCIKQLQSGDRRQKRVVSAARFKCERLKEGPCKLSDIAMLLDRQHERRSTGTFNQSLQDRA